MMSSNQFQPNPNININMQSISPEQYAQIQNQQQQQQQPNINVQQFQVNPQDQQQQPPLEPVVAVVPPKIIPQRTILTFFGDSFLSDALLKSGDIEMKFHKIIMCAGSKYIYDVFNQFPNIQKTESGQAIVPLPETITSTFSKGNIKDCLELVTKYCYANQEFDSIKAELNADNVFTVLSFAHCLGVQSLMDNVEQFLMETFVNEENVAKVINESIIYGLPKLKEFCAMKINAAFANPTNLGALLDCNYETFKAVVQNDNLDVNNEKIVCDLVLEYIAQRRKIAEEMKEQMQALAEEEMKKQQEEQAMKQVEEDKPQQEGGDEQKQPEGEGEQKPPEEEQKPPEEEQKPPEDEQKPPEEQQQPEVKNEEENAANQVQIQDPSELLNSWKTQIDEIKSSLVKQPITPEQERELILCIRFSFLTHSELLSYSSNPLLLSHKDLVLEGLSVRLNKFEGANEYPLRINLTPRKNYITNTSSPQDQPYQSNNPLINNDINDQPYQSVNSRYMNNNNNEYESQKINPEQLVSKSIIGTSTPYQPNTVAMSYDPQHNQQMYNYNANLKTDTASHSDYYNNTQPRNGNFNIAHNNNNINVGLARSVTLVRPPQDPKISAEFHKSMSLINRTRPVFKYEYDFDENGVLYYLGSMGKTAPYKNPYEIGQVKVFASSIGKGSLGDFVGRHLVNLRTMNEENSYFGVDLGAERYLIPSSYSIRNRNSSGHVMLCWNLEGSNDKVNFEVLDTRIFANSSNPKFNQKFEKERNLLKQPGCTSTWGISNKIRERFASGFRYFILKQIDKNSSGGYNMTISGFELYGEGVGKNWNFN